MNSVDRWFSAFCASVYMYMYTYQMVVWVSAINSVNTSLAISVTSIHMLLVGEVSYNFPKRETCVWVRVLTLHQDSQV